VASGIEVVQVVGHSALGGAVPVVVAICDACDHLGLKPVVLASHPDVVAYLEHAGCAVWEFPGIVRDPQPLRDLWTAMRLRRELVRRGTQIVHTHTSKGGMVGRLAGRLAGCDLVIHHTHGFYHSGLPRGIRRAVMMALEWVFSHACDYQLFVNSADREEAVTHRFLSAERALTVFNGADDPRAKAPIDTAAVRRQWGVPVDSRLMGVVTRVAARKGVDTCLRTLRALRERDMDVWMVVAGTGPELPAMKDLAEALGVSERVRFLGHLPEAARYFGCFDLAVTASEHEGQSMSVIEAIACGTPVVASDIRGHRDMVIEGATGLLCPVGDTESFACAVSSLINDEPKLRLMAANARRHYEAHFTSSRFREDMGTFYERALAVKGLNARVPSVPRSADG